MVAPTFVFLQFFGMFFSLFGVALLINKKLFSSVVDDVSKHKGVALMFAVLPLMLGSYLVTVHNICGGTKEIIVTVLGWLFFIGGSYRLLFMDHWVKLMVKSKDCCSSNLVGGIVLVFGLVLFYLSRG